MWPQIFDHTGKAFVRTNTEGYSTEGVSDKEKKFYNVNVIFFFIADDDDKKAEAFAVGKPF